MSTRALSWARHVGTSMRTSSTSRQLYPGVGGGLFCGCVRVRVETLNGRWNCYRWNRDNMAFIPRRRRPERRLPANRLGGEIEVCGTVRWAALSDVRQLHSAIGVFATVLLIERAIYRNRRAAA